MLENELAELERLEAEKEEAIARANQKEIESGLLSEQERLKQLNDNIDKIHFYKDVYEQYEWLKTQSKI